MQLQKIEGFELESVDFGLQNVHQNWGHIPLIIIVVELSLELLHFSTQEYKFGEEYGIISLLDFF